MDAGIHTTDGQVYDVMFVGTDRGQVLKMINPVNRTANPTSSPSTSTVVLVEELQVVPRQEPVLGLQIVAGQLLVTTSDELLQLPLQRCAVALTCSACVRLQDPYCGWNVLSSKCVSNANFNSMYASEFLQNVTFGRHRQCGDTDDVVGGLDSRRGVVGGRDRISGDTAVVIEQFTHRRQEDGGRDETDTGHGENRDYVGSNSPTAGHGVGGGLRVEGRYSTEELTMAVSTSCVSALIIGFIAGFLLARYSIQAI